MAKRGFRVARCGMEGVEAVAADTVHHFGRHTHDQYGMGLMLRGAQKSWSGRGIVEAIAGDVITVNPGEVHDGMSLDEHGRAWRMLYFDPRVLADAIMDLTSGLTPCAEFSLPALRDPAAARVFGALFRTMTDPHGGYSEIEAHEHLLLLLARLIDCRRATPRCGFPSAIAKARERIDDDASAFLPLSELAEIGGVSQFQLIRGFAKATGLTPHAYLVQRRLQQVRKRIAGGASLADAAQATGFADQSHMTRLFSRAYGMSPGLYAAGMR